MSILIVDDESDSLETLAEFLVDAGYRVRTAANGALALECLERELPCVLILDLLMPVMTGNEVIERVRGSARLAGVPIVVTTSDPSRAPSDLPVLKKPLDLGRLLGVVQRHCEAGRPD